MKKWYAIREGNQWINYGYVEETGLYHWEGDSSYAGYTAQEMVEKGAV